MIILLYIRNNKKLQRGCSSEFWNRTNNLFSYGLFPPISGRVCFFNSFMDLRAYIGSCEQHHNVILGYFLTPQNFSCRKIEGQCREDPSYLSNNTENKCCTLDIVTIYDLT